jgi:hypothetical protein
MGRAIAKTIETTGGGVMGFAPLYPSYNLAIKASYPGYAGSIPHSPLPFPTSVYDIPAARRCRG